MYIMILDLLNDVVEASFTLVIFLYVSHKLKKCSYIRTTWVQISHDPLLAWCGLVLIKEIWWRSWCVLIFIIFTAANVVNVLCCPCLGHFRFCCHVQYFVEINITHVSHLNVMFVGWRDFCYFYFSISLLIVSCLCISLPLKTDANFLWKC